MVKIGLGKNCVFVNPLNLVTYEKLGANDRSGRVYLGFCFEHHLNGAVEINEIDMQIIMIYWAMLGYQRWTNVSGLAGDIEQMLEHITHFSYLQTPYYEQVLNMYFALKQKGRLPLVQVPEEMIGQKRPLLADISEMGG